MDRLAGWFSSYAGCIESPRYCKLFTMRLDMQPFARGHNRDCLRLCGTGRQLGPGVRGVCRTGGSPTPTLGDFTHRRMQLVQHAISSSWSRMAPSLSNPRRPGLYHGQLRCLGSPLRPYVSCMGLPRERPEDKSMGQTVYIKGSATRLPDQCLARPAGFDGDNNLETRTDLQTPSLPDILLLMTREIRGSWSWS